MQSIVVSHLNWRIHELSSLTDTDYVELKAALGAIDNDEYKCQRCIRKYDGRNDRDEMLEKAQRTKGCTTPQREGLHKIDDLSFSRCPGNFVSSGAYYVIELFGKYQKNILPFTGSVSDQPNKIIEAFSVCEDWYIKKLEDAEKKRNLKRGHGTGTARNRRAVR